MEVTGGANWRARMVVVGTAFVALLGVALWTSNTFTESAAAPMPTPTATATPVPTMTPAPTATTAPTATAAPTLEATIEPTTTPTPEPTPACPGPDTFEPHLAVYRADEARLYLQGDVNSQDADRFLETAQTIVGSDNVINNYRVDDCVPSSTTGNVRVEQAASFEVDSAIIRDEFIPTLELGVVIATIYPQVTFVIEGHTDSDGDETYNQELSTRRAEAAADYLAGRGVDQDRLLAIGYGETVPIAPNDTDENKTLNRRIEVQLLDLLSPVAE